MEYYLWMHIANLIQDLVDNFLYLLILVNAGNKLRDDIKPNRYIYVLHPFSHALKYLRLILTIVLIVLRIIKVKCKQSQGILDCGKLRIQLLYTVDTLEQCVNGLY